jgi:DNA primase
MKFSTSAIALYMGLVFASGAVVGGFGHRLYSASAVSAKAPKASEEFRRHYMQEMKSRLNLSSDQITKLELILDETRARIQEANKKLEPEVTSIRSEQIEKIRLMLSPAQVTEYEKLRKEREERSKKKGNGPGPGF